MIAKALAVSLLWLGLATAAAAQAGPPSVARDTSNPYNSPTRSINPNSRQGTVPSSPAIRAVPTQQANPRPPTLENRGIGNGENIRQRPVTPPKPPSQTPRLNPERSD